MWVQSCQYSESIIVVNIAYISCLEIILWIFLSHCLRYCSFMFYCWTLVCHFSISIVWSWCNPSSPISLLFLVVASSILVKKCLSTHIWFLCFMKLEVKQLGNCLCVFCICKLLPNFNLKDMIFTYVKAFSWKNGKKFTKFWIK
jgi:hypothetical protein